MERKRDHDARHKNREKSSSEKEKIKKNYKHKSSESSSSSSTKDSLFSRDKKQHTRNKKSSSSSSSHGLNSKRYMEGFRDFLIKRKNIEIAGSDCYGETFRTDEQNVPIGSPILFTINGNLHNVEHKTGTSEIKILKDGIFKVAMDAEVLQPAQFAVFVNGVVNDSTISGTESGSEQVSIRQLLALRKGDVLTVINWKSASGLSGAVDLALNAGGSRVGVNASFSLFKIAPLPRLLDTSSQKNDPAPNINAKPRAGAQK